MISQETAAAAAPAGSVWAPPYRSLTVAMMLTVTAAAFEALAVATINPAITRDLGGLELYGWTFSAFMLTRLVGITVAGAEVDRQGPSVPFAIGVVLFVAGLLISGLAPSMAVLVGGRAVQGVGSGVISSVVYAIVARGFPDTLRPRMLALISTAWVVPGLIGPAIAGLIGDAFGWRWVFLGLVPFPLVAAAMAGGALRGLARETAGVRSWERPLLSVRLTLGVAMLTAGLGQPLPLSTALGIGQPLPWGIALIAAGLAVGLPALRRLLPEGTLRAAPGMPAAIACMALQSCAFFGVDAFLPLALSSLRGQTNVFAGLVLTAATMTWTTGSWLLDRLAARTSRRRFVITGFALMLAGILISIAILSPDVPPWVGILAWAVAGLGIGLTYTTLSLVTLDLAPAGQEGSSSAALQVNDVIGAALGTGVGGVLVAAFGHAGTASALQIQFLIMAAVAVLGLVASARIPAGLRGAEKA